jgi:hypothetical protein
MYSHDDTVSTEDQRRVEAIAKRMRVEGLPEGFIDRALRAALIPQPGMIDAFFDWDIARDPLEREEVVADIQGLLFVDDRDPAIAALFADPDRVSASVAELKRRLRPIVDQQGGIHALAERTGIVLPWLRRFFDTAAVPPRAALTLIKRALSLSVADVALDLSPRPSGEEADTEH